MKIVILEENAINNNDLSLDALKELGEVTSYGVTPHDKIVKYIGDAEVVLCNKANLSREILSQCKNLKYIGECATGYNNIDIVAAREMGITVTNAGQYSTMAVAGQEKENIPMTKITVDNGGTLIWSDGEKVKYEISLK